MLGTAQGVRIGITGLGVHVPAKVMTNDELAAIVETSDEWIRERTGIRERRIASQDEALTDIAMPAAVAALADAGVAAADVDLLICATVTPDMMFPTSSAILADALGYASRGGVRPARGLHRLRLCDRAGLRDARVRSLATRARGRRRRALEDPRLGGPLDARALRRRRRRGRHGAGRQREASSGSSSARTGPEASTCGIRAPVRVTSTTRTRS